MGFLCILVVPTLTQGKVRISEQVVCVGTYNKDNNFAQHIYV